MPLLRHYDHTETCRFVTFSCYRHLPLLTDSNDRTDVVNWLRRACTKHEALIFGYVIMPDHLHLLLLPHVNAHLTDLLREFKSNSAREYFRRLDGRGEHWPYQRRSLWQARGYDHNCRSVHAVLGKISYCHFNPVRRGLVLQAEEWDWSSAGWYAGKGDALLAMDSLEQLRSTVEERQAEL